jgi:hypothetical protein
MHSRSPTPSSPRHEHTLGMELVLRGNPFRTSEDYIYVMKGDVDKYQAIFGNQEYADANPIESDQ